MNRGSLLLSFMFLVIFPIQSVFSLPIQRSDFSGAAQTESFDSIPLLSPIPNFSDFDVNGIGGISTAVNDTVPGLTGDFIPTSAPVVIGMNGQGITDGRSVQFVFHDPIFQVGFQFIDVEESGATFTAFDSSGQTLETILITPQGSSGLSHFYGIQSSGIRSIVVGTTSSEGIAVDDLVYTATPVPEPSTILLLTFGLVGLMVIVRRSGKQAHLCGTIVGPDIEPNPVAGADRIKPSHFRKLGVRSAHLNVGPVNGSYK